MPGANYAISIKQPWAALIIAGIKEIEIRTWPTTIRGPILIHASKRPDPRVTGWDLIAQHDLQPLAELAGGVIGRAELTQCIKYSDAESFAADASRHRNLPEWFVEPKLYGFVLSKPQLVPFLPYAGTTFFFKVEGATLS
jgi:hypothetical protein